MVVAAAGSASGSRHHVEPGGPDLPERISLLDRTSAVSKRPGFCNTSLPSRIEHVRVTKDGISQVQVLQAAVLYLSCVVTRCYSWPAVCFVFPPGRGGTLQKLQASIRTSFVGHAHWY